jgi:mycothiol system anti-sigma-R factor
MSCGKPHATACHDVLSWVWIYVDQEIDDQRRLHVTTHLAECSPCAGQYSIALVIQARVRRTVVAEPAPAGLRAAIIAQIREGHRPVE